jgi:hypothetical protein
VYSVYSETCQPQFQMYSETCQARFEIAMRRAPVIENITDRLADNGHRHTKLVYFASNVCTWVCKCDIGLRQIVRPTNKSVYVSGKMW